MHNLYNESKKFIVSDSHSQQFQHSTRKSYSNRAKNLSFFISRSSLKLLHRSPRRILSTRRSVTFSTLPPKIREIQRDRKVELVASACIFQRSLFPLGAYVHSSQEWWWWTKGCTVEEAVGRYRRRHPL